jgi:hypothetical protein
MAGSISGLTLIESKGMTGGDGFTLFLYWVVASEHVRSPQRSRAWPGEALPHGRVTAGTRPRSPGPRPGRRLSRRR